MHLSALAIAFAVSPFNLPWTNAEGGQKNFDSSAYLDAVYVIEGFQLRCGPCNDNAPNMRQLAAFYSYEDRVKFIDLGLDRAPADYQAWTQRHQVKHHVLMDARRQLWSQLGGTGTPTTWVLDCKLNVKYSHVGTWDARAKQEIKKAIDKTLEQDCS